MNVQFSLLLAVEWAIHPGTVAAGKEVYPDIARKSVGQIAASAVVTIASCWVAREFARYFGQSCPASRPAAETVVQLTSGLVAFADPSGAATEPLQGASTPPTA